MTLAIETNPEYNTVATKFILVNALIVAIAYYYLNLFTANKYVVIGIGMALALFGSGALQTIGFGILALGISRLMEQEMKNLKPS
jgi:hypothetical protein